jgi:hypothetical protein
MEEFLGGLLGTTESGSALAAILYDIVGSTERLSTTGVREWRYHSTPTTRRSHHGRTAPGRIVKTTDDGILATFDGPGRVLRYAIALDDGSLIAVNPTRTSCR